MRILYAFQGTGNGHVSRAREVVPLLRRRVEVEIAVSGNNSEVLLPIPVTHRFHRLSFAFGRRGGIDYWRTLRDLKFPVFGVRFERSIPHDYDLIINDFEPVTAWSAKLGGRRILGTKPRSYLGFPTVQVERTILRSGYFITLRPQVLKLDCTSSPMTLSSALQSFDRRSGTRKLPTMVTSRCIFLPITRISWLSF